MKISVFTERVNYFLRSPDLEISRRRDGAIMTRCDREDRSANIRGGRSPFDIEIEFSAPGRDAAGRRAWEVPANTGSLFSLR